MTLTDYYKFVKLPTSKAKTRLDCVASTESYELLEMLYNKRGELFVYLLRPPYVKADAKRKADLAMECRVVGHVSSVFVIDVESPFAFGDYKHTTDALLFVFSGVNTVDAVLLPNATIEVFIARGQSHNQQALYNLFSNGELDTEVEALRQKAVTASPWKEQPPADTAQNRNSI